MSRALLDFQRADGLTAPIAAADPDPVPGKVAPAAMPETEPIPNRNNKIGPMASFGETLPDLAVIPAGLVVVPTIAPVRGTSPATS